ncbi:unnamed protein product [Oikopleura dioica]|nr:unnamed protein product [Oikopleura dioica]
MTFEERVEKRLNWWQKILLKSYQRLGLKFGGMDIIRALPSSIGPKLIKAARKDLLATYGDEFLEYIFEINSAKPASGELAFSSLNAGFGYAKYPMGPRMLKNHKKIPKNIHFLYGGKSWLESSVGYQIIKELEENDPNFKCTVTVVDKASHHLQCTHPDQVNSVVNEILKSAEER